MYFKVPIVVRDIMVPIDTILEFELKQPYPIIIQIKNPPKEYLEKCHDKAISFFDLFTSLEITDELMDGFKKIDAQFPKSETEPVYLDQIIFPENCAIFLKTIAKELMGAARNLTGLLRWTNNYLGPHDPFLSKGEYWSFDNIHWRPFPKKFAVFLIKQGRTLHLDSQRKNTIVDYLNSGITEPNYHELFREAWALRATDPRSSLVIGYESAEVGVKTVIRKLIQATEWIMNNLQYPPLFQILKKFSSLPRVKKNNNESFIPASIIKTVEEMMHKRNKQVHVGEKPPDSKEIERMLMDVQDLLLLLDYYSGYDFALSFVRPEKLQEIELICQKKIRKENKNKN